MPKQRTYSLDKYDLDELYNKPYEDTPEERIELKRNKGYKRMRLKTIKSGDMLECEIFPVWDTRAAYRAPKKNESRKAQRDLNRKNAVKNVVRLINANFTDADIWATFTYDDENLPPSAAAAQDEMQKYLRRLKRYIEKNKLPPLKYVYVTEFEDDKKKGKKRVHHHIVMNFSDRDIAEDLWHGGARRQARRLQPDEFGFEGLARYITKNPNGSKRYVASRNLAKPIVTRADSKMTRGGVDKIIRGIAPAKELFEKLYKGYDFNDLRAYTSDYIAGAYVYVRMRRRE